MKVDNLDSSVIFFFLPPFSFFLLLWLAVVNMKSRVRQPAVVALSSLPSFPLSKGREKKCNARSKRIKGIRKLKGVENTQFFISSFFFLFFSNENDNVKGNQAIFLNLSTGFFYFLLLQGNIKLNKKYVNCTMTMKRSLTWTRLLYEQNFIISKFTVTCRNKPFYSSARACAVKFNESPVGWSRVNRWKQIKVVSNGNVFHKHDSRGFAL